MKVRKCIIPIAGKGTRFLPITKAVSKEMLPILNKPSIFYQVKECLDSGIEEIIFVVGKHNEKLIQKFFSKDNKLEEFLDGSKKLELLNELNDILDKIKFYYVLQDENIRGSAGAIYAARKYINKDEYFAVMFGDDIVLSDTPPLKELIDYFDKCHSNIVGTSIVPDNLIKNYGLIKYKNDNIIEDFVRVDNVLDAPSKESLHGRLIVHDTIFDKILLGKKMDNNEYGLPRTLLSLNEEVRAFKFSGEYFDIGSVEGFIKANIMFGIKSNIISKDTIEKLIGRDNIWKKI